MEAQEQMDLEAYLDALCDPSVSNMVDPEGFINRTMAIERHAKREGAVPEGDDVCGFYFSMNILEKFMEKIRLHNLKHAATPALQVTGLRIWQARSKAFSTRWTEDVVITPTVSYNGNSDIHAYAEGENLVDDEGKLLILSSSRPCPNLCGTGGGPKFFFSEEHVPTERICVIN